VEGSCDNERTNVLIVIVVDDALAETTAVDLPLLVRRLTTTEDIELRNACSHTHLRAFSLLEESDLRETDGGKYHQQDVSVYTGAIQLRASRLHGASVVRNIRDDACPVQGVCCCV